MAFEFCPHHSPCDSEQGKDLNMKHNRPFDVLDDTARDYIPDNTDLVPQVAARLKGISPMMTLRTRPLVAFLIAVLILLALSGAAYALGRALGYFPGLGLVPQDAQFRVLSEPVSQTRDGITVTITQAISSADQMFVTLKVENVPAEKQSFQARPDSKMCTSYPDSYPELRFPNGESVKISGAAIDPLIGGYTAWYKFPSVPLNAAEATLFIPCIQGAIAPGILPENWEVSMRLVPAPPEVALTVIPVNMVPTVQAAPEPPAVTETSLAPEPATDKTDRLSVLQVFDTGSDYILIGTFSPPARRSDEKGVYALDGISLRDGNRQVIDDEEYPSDLDLTPYLAGASGKPVWAVKFRKGFTPPVHLTYRTRYLYSPLPQDAYTFDFDAGLNPEAGQEWNLNQEFQLAEHVVTLKKITAGANSYTFFFHTDDEHVESVGMYSRDDIQIVGYTPTSFAGRFGLGAWSLTKVYSELPKGNLRVVLSGLYLYGNYEDWTMVWQP
jgi:hypothetical protein